MNGPDGAWFRGAQARHAGHISVGSVEADVVFEDADHDLDDEIDEEYRRKYGRSSTAVDHITSAKARSTRSGSCRAREERWRSAGSEPALREGGQTGSQEEGRPHMRFLYFYLMRDVPDRVRGVAARACGVYPHRRPACRERRAEAPLEI